MTVDAVVGAASSRQRIAGREQELLQRFHEGLIELLPEQPMLRTDEGRRVSHLLVQSVLWVIDTREAEPVVQQSLVDVGAEVHRLGFPDSGYQAVGHALLRAVRSVYSGEWSGALSSRWVGYYDWLRAFWLHGAGAARLAEEQPLLSAGAGGAAAGPPPDEPFPEPGSTNPVPVIAVPDGYDDGALDDVDDDPDDGPDDGPDDEP